MIPFAVIHIMLTFIIICCNSISQKKLLIKLKSQASHALSLIISPSLPVSHSPSHFLSFSPLLLSFLFSLLLLSSPSILSFSPYFPLSFILSLLLSFSPSLLSFPPPCFLPFSSK